MLMNMSVLAGEADLVNPLPPIFAEALSRNRKVKLIEGKEAQVFWIALVGARPSPLHVMPKWAWYRHGSPI